MGSEAIIAALKQHDGCIFLLHVGFHGQAARLRTRRSLHISSFTSKWNLPYGNVLTVKQYKTCRSEARKMEQKDLVMEGGVVGIGINLVGASCFCTHDCLCDPPTACSLRSVATAATQGMQIAHGSLL